MRPTFALSILCLPALFGADWKLAESPLITPWTSQVTPAHALPEYPRPQMVRKDWINLNGLWDYAIQPQSASQPAKFDGSILVPFPVESALSGVRKPVKPDERLWYRRKFTAPNLKGKRLLLHFGAVDWRAEVTVNGKPVGTHEGGYDPFTFDITPALKSKGPQEVVVAVWDPSDSGPQPRGKQVLEPNNIWYTAVSGIWQTVWLEPVPEHYISGLVLTPDLDGNRLLVTAESGQAGDFDVRVTLAGKTVGEASGKLNAESDVILTDVKPWSPDSPTLYDLEVSLPGGDRVTRYFGSCAKWRCAKTRRDSTVFSSTTGRSFSSARSIRDGGRMGSIPHLPMRRCGPTSKRSKNSASICAAST